MVSSLPTAKMDSEDLALVVAALTAFKAVPLYPDALSSQARNLVTERLCYGLVAVELGIPILYDPELICHSAGILCTKSISKEIISLSRSLVSAIVKNEGEMTKRKYFLLFYPLFRITHRCM